MNPWDYGTVCFSLGILFLYHAHYYISIITRGSASHTALSTNVKIALSWIKKHKEKADAPNVTLAIQTLRNTILIAIFVGGNSLSFGLNYSINYKDIIGDEALQLQYIILSVCLLCSFLCWACVIRYASHLGYYIGTLSYKEAEKPKDMPVTTTPEEVNIVPMDSIDNEKPNTESSKKKKKVDPIIQCANMIALVLIFFK